MFMFDLVVALEEKSGDKLVSVRPLGPVEHFLFHGSPFNVSFNVLTKETDGPREHQTNINSMGY